jgi:hypothetical protein
MERARRKSNLYGAPMLEAKEEKLAEAHKALLAGEFEKAGVLLRRLCLYYNNSNTTGGDNTLVESLQVHLLTAETMQIISDRDFLSMLNYPNQNIGIELNGRKSHLVELLGQLHNISQTTSNAIASAGACGLILEILQLSGHPDTTADADFEQMLSKLRAIDPAYNYVHLALSRLLLSIAANYLPSGRSSMAMETALWCLPLEKARHHYQGFGLSGVYKATELIVNAAIQLSDFEVAKKYVDQLVEYCKSKGDDKHWVYQSESLKGNCQLAYMQYLDKAHSEVHSKLSRNLLAD